MFEVFINSLGIRKRYKEPYTKERINEIIEEIRLEYESVGAFRGDITVYGKKHIQHTTINVAFLNRLAHYTYWGMSYTLGVIDFAKLSDVVKVRIVNDENGKEEILDCVSFGQKFSEIENTEEWLKKNKVEFVGNSKINTFLSTMFWVEQVD